jgi:hypothetical protein
MGYRAIGAEVERVGHVNEPVGHSNIRAFTQCWLIKRGPMRGVARSSARSQTTPAYELATQTIPTASSASPTGSGREMWLPPQHGTKLHVAQKYAAAGLRFATEEVEHYLKWRGISQLLLDRDGVIFSHGNLFFLIPDRAFASSEDRLAFIRDVHERLGERARALSEKHVSVVLKQPSPAS